jgi:Prenyltransferase and squalene oxidase repeat
VLRSEATLSRKSIDDAIARALACLRGHFRTPPPQTGTVTGTAEPAGWYHYLDDPYPGVTASAVGLYCFSLAGAEFERTDQVLNYLMRKQVKDANGSGWAVRTTNDFPIVEATAWVLRCFSLPQARTRATSAALDAGVEWLEANQNTDFGWGSYTGQPSRTFTTALSVLALRESGGSRTVISNAHKWLIETQCSPQPAWGPLPGSEPTMLHTSFALMALLSLTGAFPATAVHQTVEWLTERLKPGAHVEMETAVEEYDVPYVHNKADYTFQNSLPHFAGPVTLTALLCADADPLQKKVFDTITEIVKTQEAKDPNRSGSWELPRSPRRPSIWAVWPFVAALSNARVAIFPSTDSTATLLFPGCALIQSSPTTKHLTRRLLIKNAVLDWLRLRKVAVGLWSIAAITVIIPLILWRTGQFTLDNFLVALALPVLLLTFQILWDRRGSSGDKEV